jgi:HD-GYP domain-containing protein (c-di-GMP phosphodiesterase class II)
LRAVEKSLRLLCVAHVDDVLLLRRLLRDTSYHVIPAAGQAQALRHLSEGIWHAVLADDDAKLLAEVERRHPNALRILLAKSERRPQLVAGAHDGRFALALRPYFATRVRELLADHERRAQFKPEGTVAAGERTFDGETKPYAVVSSAPVARRRVLIAMAELAEAKSGHSSGHGQRTSHLAVGLARAIGMPGEEVEPLGEAALLHDVGELAIHSTVLTQKRRLTPNELRELCCHVEAGEAILRRCGLGRTALTAIRHHHERWDGRGYPDGFMRSSIPLAARVLAVADTWDALATARPWRARMTPVEAEKTLELLGGSQLDPQLVEVFLKRKIFQSIDWSDPPRAEELLL